jgi:hypothetical protein
VIACDHAAVILPKSDFGSDPTCAFNGDAWPWLFVASDSFAFHHLVKDCKHDWCSMPNPAPRASRPNI